VPTKTISAKRAQKITDTIFEIRTTILLIVMQKIKATIYGIARTNLCQHFAEIVETNSVLNF